MGKLPVIIATVVVFILAVSTASPVSAQENWENAMADLEDWVSGEIADSENWLSGQISSILSSVSDSSDRIDNLYAFIENLLGASALGREFSVYALTDDGLEPVSPLSVAPSLFDNRDFSPVYVDPNGMLMLWVVDKDAQTPIDGTLDIGMSMFSFSGNGLDPWVMMTLLQQGSMFGESLFSFAISAGVVTVPAISGFGETWMATVSATDYKDFQFVIKIGESPSTPSTVISPVGSLVRGEPAVIMATISGEMVDGTLTLSDGTEGADGMVSFIVPDTSSFVVTLREGGTITKTQTFYTTDGESAQSPADGDGNDAYLIAFAVIIVLLVMCGIYKKKTGKSILGWAKKPHFPR